LTYGETGDADAGIVYPAAAVQASKNPAAAREFIEYITD
jgi:ABC-type Fe3+ transport system substrate-binding protein